MRMRVAIFVDGANMFYAQRDNGWHIDYKKVYDHFTKGREIWGAYYFTGTPPYDNITEIKEYRAFRGALIHIGYYVVDKEAKIITDRTTGSRTLKANLDVEITLHIMATMGSYDEIIFLGGDSDFAPLIKHLRENGKHVICVGRRQSTARELINVSNKFIDLNEIKDEIEKRKGEAII
jgi:uncharacterized LabA/DUF88 family protein